jgi:hypothetical protein
MATMLEQIRAIVGTTAARWQTLMTAIPADLAQRQPQPGEWSAVECLRHLTDAEQFVWPVRVRALLASEAFPAFNPTADGRDYDALTPVQLADDFAQRRAANLALLATITEADFARTGTHPELGAITLGQLLHEWAAHDLMHTVQAERALMQPFIMGTGPWRFYFADHDVAPTGASMAVKGE